MRHTLAAAAAAAAVTVASSARFGRESAARSDAGPPSPPCCGASLHVWGPLAIVRQWGQRMAGRCPRDLAWGAGAGVAVMENGDLVVFKEGNVASLAGAAASDVAMDGENVVFYATTAGSLMRWAPFGKGDATVPAAAGLPGCTVTMVSCGSAHCLAIDVEGVVYSWASRKGGSKMGVLGRPTPEAEDVPAPVLLPGGARAAHCACGDSHRCSVCVCFYLRVHKESRLRRTYMHPFIVCYSVCVCSVVVGTRGQVWTFGSNRWMQVLHEKRALKRWKEYTMITCNLKQYTHKNAMYTAWDVWMGQWQVASR